MRTKAILQIIVVFTLFSLSCQPSGIFVNPPGFWEKLEGEWQLGPTYKINREEYDVFDCDQFTILTIRPLTFEEGKRAVHDDSSPRVNDFIEIDNKACEESALYWGTILGKRQPLPYSSGLTARLNFDCHKCRYSDLLEIDIESCRTDSLDFSFLELTEEQLKVQFVTNLYNRQVQGEPVADTIQLSLLRRDSSVNTYTVSRFDIDHYPKANWLSFEELDHCGTVGDVESCPDGIDGRAVCFNANWSAVCIDESLKTAMGEDNELTVSFWINPTSLAWPKQILYAKHQIPQYGPFIFSLEQDKVVLEMNDGFSNFQRFVSSGSIRAGEWSHIAFSYRNQDLLLCINGNIDRRGKIHSWLSDADADHVYLGNSDFALDNDLLQGFQGKMDELIFFEKFLNEGVIFQLYQWHLNN
ncbi:MAG: LamG domain-containing protein [Phaeodactylibacter sp.]|nr:LamG domain-containing protein [Phaeodactylibacter sp.]